MGREDIITHIEHQAHGTPDSSSQTEHVDDIFCEHCGGGIDPTTPAQGDYVVHRVPEHGADEIRSVFYCGSSCFTDAMDNLFDA